MNQADHPVRSMCRVLGLSPSGYYAWLQRSPSERAIANQDLLGEIEQIHKESRESYGRPRMYAELRDNGRLVNHKRVGRLMRMGGIKGATRRKKWRTTTRDQNARPAPDLVERNFNASGPNQLWVADITYIPTGAGFLFLAVVLDVWSRRVVGWAMASHLKTTLVLQALEMALGQRRPTAVIHHSDQLNSSSIRRLPSGSGANRPAYVRRWARSAMPTTTPCAKASSPPWSASSWSGSVSVTRPRRR
jgi:putative transposase